MKEFDRVRKSFSASGQDRTVKRRKVPNIFGTVHKKLVSQSFRGFEGVKIYWLQAVPRTLR